jgi:hypothetical protein
LCSCRSLSVPFLYHRRLPIFIFFPF